MKNVINNTSYDPLPDDVASYNFVGYPDGVSGFRFHGKYSAACRHALRHEKNIHCSNFVQIELISVQHNSN